MKKLLLSAFVAFAMLASTKTLAQQGFGTNTPSKSAAVDIVSSQRGLLIPRLNLVATNDATPIASTPAQSLLVYNNATAGSGTTAVTPGFYYWDTDKWVRIVSTATEKNTTVVGGSNVVVNSGLLPDGVTTQYTVNVEGGDTPGQVLVTITNPSYNPADPNSEEFISEWVNPADFISGVNGITITPNPTTGVNEIGIGGSLTDTTGTEIATDPTTGKTLAITGLEILNAAAFNPAIQNIMVMGADGILKQVAPKTLIEDAIAEDNLTAKALTSAGGIITVNGTTSVTNSVLKDVELGIANKSIGAEKLNPGLSTPGQIATVVETTPGDATTKVVQYQDPSTAIGKTLTTDNIIGVGADATAASATNANSLNGAVLTPTYLKIKDNSITALQIGTGAVGTDELAADAVTNAKLADNAVQTENILDGTIANADLATQSVTADKMQSKNTAAGTNAALGTVPVADGVGGVTYQTVASAVGENLTTDGKIVIGSTNATTLADAVLVPTRLSIAAESITSADIKNGTITTTDIKAPNSSTDNNLDGDENMVMVTDTNGDVTWIAQSSLANKDNYNFTTPLAKDAGTANTNGGTDYTVSIATASATTLGVVKQSAATGEEITIATDGSLSINESNVNVGLVPGTNTPQGDVSGNLSNLTVGAIQGIPVSDVNPTTANNVLKYNGTEWAPAKLEGADITGEQLTSTSLTIPANAAILADLNIEIKPGTAPNQILTTTGTTGNLTTGWATPNSLVEVNNALEKEAVSGTIQLGGNLIKATAINTAVGATSNTLAITGLENVAPKDATKKNKVIVAETTDGILRTVDKVIVVTNVDIATDTNYSFYAPEVVISVTLANNDQTIIFPSAASAEGQVINIKIANKTESHTGYLYLGSDVVTPTPSPLFLAYGSMPYQSWIVKSNGTTWEIVGRN